MSSKSHSSLTIRSGVRAGAQTVHLKMQIDGNDIVGDDDTTTTTSKDQSTEST